MARIGIDLDGVGYDFGAAFKNYLTRWQGWQQDAVEAPCDTWHFYRAWGMTDAEFASYCHAGVNDEILFLAGDPIDCFPTQLMRLREAGHVIVIITDRSWGSNNRAQSNTYAWLAKHDIPWDEVHFTADKTSVQVDYMIDDKPENYEALIAVGVDVMLCDRPWNQHMFDAVRVRDIGEFVDYVLAPEWERPLLRAPGLITATEPRTDRFLMDLASVPIEHSATGEVRSVSSTGGEKGVKPARFDLLPYEALVVIAEHFGKGAEKYSAHNWRRGYEWSKSFAALMRHLAAFWSGEDIDPETGSPHLAAAGFHIMALLVFMQDFPEFDDRFKRPDPPDEEPPALALVEPAGISAADSILGMVQASMYRKAG